MPQTLMHAEANPCIARAKSNQKYPCPMANAEINTLLLIQYN